MTCLYSILLLGFVSSSYAYREWFTMEGEAFAVKCPDTEDDERVTWHLLKMNRTIPTDGRKRIYSSGIYLWFLPVSPKDSGNYICVKHKSDSQINETVSVTIHPYKKGTFYYPEDLYSYTSGSPGSGTIYCPSIDKYKNPSDVRWYKDCKYLDDPRYAIRGSTLYIADADESDNGNYTCQFTYRHHGSKFNVSATRPFEVKEGSSPMLIQVISPPDNAVIKVEVGSPLNLTCKGLLAHEKQKMPPCCWEVSGHCDEYLLKTYLVPNQGYFAECVLSIKEVREEDLDVTFMCVLSNDIELRTVNVTLQRKEPHKGHNNTYLIVGFVILFVVATVSMVLYKIFLVDIVLLYRRLFMCTKSKNDAMSAMEKRIQESRRLIILLTKCLATNDHFAYEHHIAFYNALIQNNTKVILLEMERIRDYEQLQDSLRHLVNQQDTIKWKEKYMSRPFSPDTAFWKYVRYQMPARHNLPVTNPPGLFLCKTL
ncbi:interleukin-1 receptor-like 1 isoform X2 [Paroedura picta]|uniref:interleukin-1 receptor-like 1 isoform X2 n=1 Tax=Paroedura picta TaxID=143630 RepID=UPI004056AAD1